MKVNIEKLRKDFNRDTLWTRIHFISDDGERESTVLVCASHEYLWNLFKTKDYSEEQKKLWLGSVIKKWSEIGIAIFADKVHYEPYATTQDGYDKGLEFLNNEINP